MDTVREGRFVPEIETVDHNGVPLRLSDYRVYGDDYFSGLTTIRIPG